MTTKIKEFEVIGSSYQCNINCKFCTAKITLWPSVKNNYEKLYDHFAELDRLNVRFYYFTMSGNGEPSLNSIEDLQLIKGAVTKYRHMFDTLRFQTSGALFYDQEKFDLLKDDFYFEITRYAPDHDLNIEAMGKDKLEKLGYDRDYTKTENFKNAKIHFNAIARLENLENNFAALKSDIKHYIDSYDNIVEISPKVLNVNTLTGQADNRYSQWILNHALTNKHSQLLISALSESFEAKEKYNDFFDYIEWKYKNVPIMFHVKKHRYGQSTIVFYGGEMIDFKLNKIDLDQLIVQANQSYTSQVVSS